MKQCKECESVTINVNEKTGICECCYYRTPLLDLLSVIHNDPDNKYVDVAGLNGAVIDAMVKIVHYQEL